MTISIAARTSCGSPSITASPHDDLGFGGSSQFGSFLSPIGRFAAVLQGQDRGGGSTTYFVINWIVLQNEAKRLGIEPTWSEIEEAIFAIPRFSGPNGKFSPSIYDDYATKQLGRHGGTGEEDLQEVVRGYLKYTKLRALLGSVSRPTSWEVDQRYLEQYEQFKAHEIFLDRENFSSEDISITDEAIKQFYEEQKETPQVR